MHNNIVGMGSFRACLGLAGSALALPLASPVPRTLQPVEHPCALAKRAKELSIQTNQRATNDFRKNLAHWVDLPYQHPLLSFVLPDNNDIAERAFKNWEHHRRACAQKR